MTKTRKASPGTSVGDLADVWPEQATMGPRSLPLPLSWRLRSVRGMVKTSLAGPRRANVPPRRGGLTPIRHRRTAHHGPNLARARAAEANVRGGFPAVVARRGATMPWGFAHADLLGRQANVCSRRGASPRPPGRPKQRAHLEYGRQSLQDASGAPP